AAAGRAPARLLPAAGRPRAPPADRLAPRPGRDAPGDRGRPVRDPDADRPLLRGRADPADRPARHVRPVRVRDLGALERLHALRLRRRRDRDPRHRLPAGRRVTRQPRVHPSPQRRRRPARQDSAARHAGRHRRRAAGPGARVDAAAAAARTAARRCAAAARGCSSSPQAENASVLYTSQSVPADASSSIQKAGGALVYSYDQIGVAIASSTSSSFRDNLLKDQKVENASGTSLYATQLNDNAQANQDDSANGPPQGDLPNAPASDADSLSPLQWDMRQIHAPEAHAITGGSPAVLVGDIDTGIDFNHPDLRQNIDVANSANCVSGAPVPGTAAQADNGHG